jgi:hypothetical protein
MSDINLVIKMALENTVLCRGTHGPKESYEYAARMGEAIKKTIAKTLSDILESEDPIDDNIRKLISDINK